MSFNKKTVEDIDVAGKRVLVRVDFNVPQDETGAITDDRRIRAALPTIQYLIEHNARVILTSHLGRPKGGPEPKYSLAPVAARLGELIHKSVPLAPDSVGDAVQTQVNALADGDVLLLENVRFHPEEEKNDPAFATELASLAELYVNDAFGTAHRAHASTEGVAHHLPGVAGFLLKKELDYLGDTVNNPKRPFVAILGGAKVKDKISVIEALLPKVDTLIIGGGMAYTFFKAQGKEIGKSLLDAGNIEFAKGLLAQHGDKIVLPVDVIVTNGNPFGGDVDSLEVKPVSVDAIPADWEGVDIGPVTIKAFAAVIQGAATVIWNGPAGIFEIPPLRGRHQRRSQGAGREPGDHHRRRRRLGGGGRTARLCRPDDPHLHRRRRLAGVPGRQRIARRFRPAGQVSSHSPWARSGFRPRPLSFPGAKRLQLNGRACVIPHVAVFGRAVGYLIAALACRGHPAWNSGTYKRA